MRWSVQFIEKLKNSGINYKLTNFANNWPETLVINNKVFFIKSITYNKDRSLYFVGIDPKKLSSSGDFVLLCCGIEFSLSDIFIIPWEIFFSTLEKGEPTNTYKPPRKYLQYKSYIKYRNSNWIMSVQGGSRPQTEIGNFRYGPMQAINKLEFI